MNLQEAKRRAFEIALTLPDDESADVVRVAKRKFEVRLNTVYPVRPVWVRTGWLARDDAARQARARAELEQSLTPPGAVV